MGLRTSTPTCIVALRSSEGLATASNGMAQVWTNLTHEFTVPAARPVELICEYRGIRGRAFFDPDSLKLIRLTNATAPVKSGPRGKPKGD